VEERGHLRVVLSQQKQIGEIDAAVEIRVASERGLQQQFTGWQGGNGPLCPPACPSSLENQSVTRFIGEQNTAA